MPLELKTFQKHIKKERESFLKDSYERAYQAFNELGYSKQLPEYFEKNASEVVEKMREQCWNDFLEEEKVFTSRMMEYLLSFEDYSGLSNEEAIKKYVNTFPEHTYQLHLSNTQSRRSRAGKEFEHIIELILIGAGVSLDSQGNIGKECFAEKGLGKLVDTVSPGVIEFEINKRDVVLISAKTSLRERWQEVPEEMGRTGAREMFLATLDAKVSKNVLDTLYEANIQLTTTKANKEANYKDNARVLTFEDLIHICKENATKWESYLYSALQAEQAVDLINKQIEKHKEHTIVKAAYERRMLKYIEYFSKK